jgi:hypothetical protein
MTRRYPRHAESWRFLADCQSTLGAQRESWSNSQLLEADQGGGLPGIVFRDREGPGNAWSKLV